MRNFFLFLLYSFLYLCVGGSLIGLYLGYSPFACFSYSTKEVFLNPFSDWYTLYMRFQYDNWAVNSLKNLLIFFVFLFYFPVWFGLWLWVRKVHWLHLIFKPFLNMRHHHAAPLPKTPVVAQSMTARPAAMPKMRGFGGAALALAEQQKQAEQQKAQNQSAENENDDLSDEISKMANAVDADAVDALTPELAEQIKALGAKYGYELFENVRLDDLNVALVLATDSVAFMMSFLTVDREWIADEDAADDDLEPTWFSAQGLITSPFYLMEKASALLREKEPDSEVIPTVVLARGTLLNASAMAPVWQAKKGVVALLDDEAKGDDLPVLEDLLKAKAPTQTPALTPATSTPTETEAESNA